MASLEASRTTLAMERQAIVQGDRLRAATPAASTLAYRCLLHQCLRDLLLLVQRSGWVQSFYRALGPARVDEGGRHRGDSGTSQGDVPRGKAANHLGQRAAVHRTGFQGVYSHLGHDACADFTVLPAVEWEAGALAQVAEERMH